MHGFQLDTSTFPRITDEGLTKRGIATRAADPEHFKLIEAAYRLKPDQMAKQACLYFVMPDGQQVCKIGIAQNPYERLRILQTGCWLPLKIKALLWYPDMGQAASHEFAALKLAKSENLRLKGEWVALDHMEAIGLALTAAAKGLRFTDSFGLIHQWFPEFIRQKEAAEEDFYTRSSEKLRAKLANLASQHPTS